MTQKIKATYVTFEQAKWLKEKGFNVKVEGLFFDGEFINIFPKKANNTDFASTRYNSAPEQGQVVEWLRVNHGIWIYVLPYSTLFRPYAEELVDNDKFGKWEGHKYSTPQEAYSAAFDYILNSNLL
jgi:hypothetical protein